MADFELRYHRNWNKADKVPRTVMYIDMGWLMGVVMMLERDLEQMRGVVRQMEFDRARG